MRGNDAEGPPPVRVLLPDGQALVGGLRGWTRSPAGAWLGEVTLTVWQERDGGVVEAAEHQITLPSTHVRPLAGVSYRAVRTRGTVQAAVRGPSSSAYVEGVWPPSGDRWIVCPGGLVPGARTVHHAGCWLPADGGAVLSGDEARVVLAESGVSACEICGVDRLKSSG
ncbi:hypothetical protein DRB96_22465 [Streptomyces sp. ICC1]|nr:hypothetical protein DRB89_22065 [Streptomyces sp. ICC4]AWZ14565.1 hypothetical protein DRB96_22465 [Streptomyces sp. ICC1]